jgi:D-alanyl-D-alanine carboxypeptidase
MPAEDLAKWEISFFNEKSLKPASYHDFETEVLLKNGLGTGYGHGVGVRSEAGHRSLSHGGEVSGFTSENIIFPDESVALVALTHQDAADASGAIARGFAPLLLASDVPATREKLMQARKIFEGLQHGPIDRSLFTENPNFYFDDRALTNFAGSLGSRGAPDELIPVRQGLRGGR